MNNNTHVAWGPFDRPELAMNAAWVSLNSAAAIKREDLDMEHDEWPKWVKSSEYQLKLKEALFRLQDPVEIALTRAVIRNFGNVERDKLVSEYGRPFVGIARPRGYRRQWMIKLCFRNAGILADGGRGTYCEGFRLGEHGFLFHHAWITLDGRSAVDVTLPNATEYRYFGIPLSGPIFRRLHHTLGLEQRAWRSYFDLSLDERVIAALKKMRAGGLL